MLKGSVSQSIELKENVAYSSVNAQLANNQSIAVESNVVYGTSVNTTEPFYDEVHY